MPLGIQEHAAVDTAAPALCYLCSEGSSSRVKTVMQSALPAGESGWEASGGSRPRGLCTRPERTWVAQEPNVKIKSRKESRCGRGCKLPGNPSPRRCKIKAHPARLWVREPRSLAHRPLLALRCRGLGLSRSTGAGILCSPDTPRLCPLSHPTGCKPPDARPVSLLPSAVLLG